MAQIVDNNHRVVFDTESYIENKKTGSRTPLERRNNVYVLDPWLVPSEGFARPA